MKNYFTVLSGMLFFLFSTLVFSDAVYHDKDNLLKIPFVELQNQYYNVEFNYQPPDKLKLSAVTLQSKEIDAEQIVPLYSGLNFHLSNILVFGNFLAADVSYLSEDLFQLNNLAEAVNLPRENRSFRSNHFRGSSLCMQCHNGLKDEDQNDVSIISDWNTTMMANSTRDPFWQAKLKTELIRTPALENEIHDTCTRCHAPMANEEARKANAPIQAVFGDGILNEDNPYFNLAMNGVSCSLCHQISPASPFGTEAGFSGNFQVESEGIIYGPYENVSTTPMETFVGYTPIFSEHIKSSEVCASCHELTTPYTDENGNILSQGKEDEFPEQSPYSEWLNSEFVDSKSCQDCHMERVNGVIIASQPRNLTTERDNFARHAFLGSNQLMLSILQNNRKKLGVTPLDFSKSIANAGKLLSKAAELSFEDVEKSNDELQFSVRITSKTGHKLPSGYPSRRVILHVTVLDNQNQVVFESGKMNADGSVAGLDSDQDNTRHEPHYPLIDSEDKVQVYEAVMEDYQNNITYTLFRAKQYRKDNRILPSGFDKDSAPDKIQVKGEAKHDVDFQGGGDTVKYKIAGLSGESYTLKAELVYQTLGHAHAQDLFSVQAEEVSRFKQMFYASDYRYASMMAIETKIKN